MRTLVLRRKITKLIISVHVHMIALEIAFYVCAPNITHAKKEKKIIEYLISTKRQGHRCRHQCMFVCTTLIGRYVPLAKVRKLEQYGDLKGFHTTKASRLPQTSTKCMRNGQTTTLLFAVPFSKYFSHCQFCFSSSY